MHTPISFLYSLQKFGMKFGLRNIRRLLSFAGDPHRRFKSIHIAGTNGKGSTSSMIAAILTSAGYSVGLYTSPHLVRFNERIRINGEMISDNDLHKYVGQLRPEIEQIGATFFEAATAVAFMYFAEKKVDFAVIETGLGGRLDSTNVITPLVSVITTIGKDHMEQLGDTIEAIAFEKAGIIKRKVPVVIGKISSPARDVMIAAAAKKSAPLYETSRLRLPAAVSIELAGDHQRMNARTAIAAVNIVAQQRVIGNDAVRNGLARTSELTGLRGRQELIPQVPAVLLDAGHNPDGIRTLIKRLKKDQHQRIVIIFGVMKDKDYRTMVRMFKQIGAVIVAVQPAGERALSVMEIIEQCKRNGLESIPARDVAEALHIGRKKAGLKGLLVITGSHYLIGEILPLIEKKS